MMTFDHPEIAGLIGKLTFQTIDHSITIDEDGARHNDPPPWAFPKDSRNRFKLVVIHGQFHPFAWIGDQPNREKIDQMVSVRIWSSFGGTEDLTDTPTDFLDYQSTRLGRTFAIFNTFVGD